MNKNSTSLLRAPAHQRHTKLRLLVWAHASLIVRRLGKAIRPMVIRPQIARVQGAPNGCSNQTEGETPRSAHEIVQDRLAHGLLEGNEKACQSRNGLAHA